ncbi:MAG: formylmethanofuran dehydrogenase subunit C [Candidatus Freyarchaeota archaeon]|nr:formylmethanofuran dehydrogenase subunit C [Candidatus Freyrarchaeum guaymaensis]
MKVELTPIEKPKVPVEAEVISPDVFSGRSVEEIGELEVWRGNRKKKLKDLFRISGDAAGSSEETTIIINGDVSYAKRIGQNMSSGEIVIKGSAGMHVGAGMKGGRIVVEGDADHWAGAEMKAGILHIKGNAGNYLGGGYRGGTGMSALKKGVYGTIIVEGNAGSEVGAWMSNGKIIVKGNVGAFAGVHMSGGIIVIHGDAGERLGGEMTGGTIVVMGRVQELLPSFEYRGEVSEVEVDGEKISGPFLSFSGDLAEDGKGMIYILKEKNPHLTTPISGC